MKKNIFMFLILSCGTSAAYESGFEDNAFVQHRPIKASPNCFALLQKTVAVNEWEWQETHCKAVAQKIIACFKKNGIVHEQESAQSDMRDFVHTPMGQALLSHAQVPEHMVFLYQRLWQCACICC